jgi:hemerythrin-like domain-containing protein
MRRPAPLGHNTSRRGVRRERGTVDPLETLRLEHRTALCVAQAARRWSADAQAQRGPDTAYAEQVIDFFRYFTNACHSPKEEDLLFTALHRHGLAWDASPLRELVGEHGTLRVTLDSASDWLRLADAGVPGSLHPLLHDLELFLDVLERHIALEEQVLFPLAQERLHARDLDELAAEFADIACDERQEGVHDYYAGVARALAGAST